MVRASDSPFFSGKAPGSEPRADESLSRGVVCPAPGVGWTGWGAGTGVGAGGFSDAHPGAEHPQGAAGSVNPTLLPSPAPGLGTSQAALPFLPLSF